jgi:hypothetical protein
MGDLPIACPSPEDPLGDCWPQPAAMSAIAHANNKASVFLIQPSIFSAGAFPPRRCAPAKPARLARAKTSELAAFRSAQAPASIKIAPDQAD